MTTAAHISRCVNRREPWREPYGSHARPCFPWVNLSCEPCEPYKGQKTTGIQGQCYSTPWRGQHIRPRHNMGTLGFTRFTVGLLSCSFSILGVNPRTVHRVHGSRLDHGGTMTALGSFRGRRGAGGAEPRLFALHKKIEIENPFSAVGG